MEENKINNYEALSAELSSEIYSQRMLVFLEISPQSNQYRQVLLTPKQYKKVSDSIFIKLIEKKPDGKQIVEIEESDEIYTLPDLMDIYGHTKDSIEQR